MNIRQVAIPEPCSVPWDRMDGTGSKRFCGQCAKTVTDISRMTAREAQAFITANPEACVQMDVVGETIVFEAPPRDSTVLRGTAAWGRRFARAGVVLGLGVSAPALASGDLASEVGWIEWVSAWFSTETSLTSGPVKAPAVKPGETVTEPVVEPNRPVGIGIPELQQPVTPNPVVPITRPVEPVVPPIRRLGGRMSPAAMRVLKQEDHGPND